MTEIRDKARRERLEALFDKLLDYNANTYQPKNIHSLDEFVEACADPSNEKKINQVIKNINKQFPHLKPIEDDKDKQFTSSFTMNENDKNDLIEALAKSD